MDLSLYNSAAAMRTTARWQELIAENLASSNIAGFKKGSIAFDAVAGGSLTKDGAAETQNPADAVFPTVGTSTNFSEGAMRPTNVETDVAITGPGFFQVEMADGSTSFTRDGEFHWSAQGQLVTGEGNPVISSGGYITREPGNNGPITIAPNGTVSQGGTAIGQIDMVEFEDPSVLKRLSGSYYAAVDENSVPLDAENSTLRQGYLESSNVSVVEEMANMITAMRLFEANQKVIQINDQLLGKTISDIGQPI